MDLCGALEGAAYASGVRKSTDVNRVRLQRKDRHALGERHALSERGVLTAGKGFEAARHRNIP